jgi:hypothetical protein
MTNPSKFDPTVNFHMGIPDLRIKHWALYEPASRRFLFSSESQEIAHLQEIRMLCSSRYNLFLCDISTAENYHSNILDNTCCDNWSVTGGFNESDLFSAPVYNITTLVPSVHTHIAYSLIQQQKNWIQFVNYWTTWLRHGIRPWPQIDAFIESMLGLKFDDTSSQNFFTDLEKLANNIKLQLYLGTDIDSTQEKIIKLLESNVWYPKIGS